MTRPLTLPQAVRLLRAQGDDQHAQVLEDMLDAAPWGEYEAERNQEPPECQHPWTNEVCVECGVVIGLPRMHPEES